MRVLVTGYTGMLGRRVRESLAQIGGNVEVFGAARSPSEDLPRNRRFEGDVSDSSFVRRIMIDLRPAAVVHCAALTDVNACESRRDEAQKLHVESTQILAEYKMKLVYVSTDSVFDGRRGDYHEDDETHPLNHYASTKLAGEHAAAGDQADAVIFRTNIYGSHAPKHPGKSLAEWALGALNNGEAVRGFHDVYFNPLYTGQVAELIREVLTGKTFSTGIYHAGCAKPISKYEFLCLLARRFGYDETVIESVSVDAMDFDAERPKNTTLNTERLRAQYANAGSLELAAGLDRFYSDYQQENGAS